MAPGISVLHVVGDYRVVGDYHEKPRFFSFALPGEQEKDGKAGREADGSSGVTHTITRCIASLNTFLPKPPARVSV
jgi:hypothetical protein